MTCPNTKRNQALGDFKAGLSRMRGDGLVAVAVRVEEGVVVDFVIWTSLLPEEWERLQRTPPHKTTRGAGRVKA